MREAKWVVIGRPNCKWCDKVLHLLDGKNIKYTYLNLHNSLGLVDFFDASGLKTVPQVFIDGNLIGGFEATEMWFVEAGL